VETIVLLPLSQAEIERAPPPQFLERAFAGDLFARDLGPEMAAGQTADLVERVLAGGFPEALARATAARRRAWLAAYAQSLAERDVADIAQIDKGDRMWRVIELAALMSGQLLNMSEIGAKAGLDSKTVDRWLSLLDKVFLAHRVRPWFRNDLKRIIKAPKLYFVDSGLLAALRGDDLDRLSRNRRALGPLLECFVYAELSKAIALGEARTTISHYRDKDQVEVDFVLERTPGRIVGIEVKASATVRPEDFKGLSRLRDATGEDFALGVLLHDGERVMAFGERLIAAPFSILWR
jgi:hypothetical protein